MTPHSGRVVRHILCALVIGGCAREEMPPGTGPDYQAPSVVETFPTQGAAVPDLDGDAFIKFDEPLGDPRSLSRVVQTSPAWPYDIRAGRTSLRIRPRDGWRPGVAYTFRIPPGLRDLVRNQTREPIELSFTTGEEFMATRVGGVVWDRETVRKMRDIAVQVTGGDSVPYAAVSDTGGNFALAALPTGYYWAYAFRDQNQNRLLDRGFEPYDSGLVSLPETTSAVRLELWLTVPDSTAPILGSARATDSLNVRLEFDDLLEPDAPLDSASVRVSRAETGEAWPVERFAIGDLALPDSIGSDEAVDTAAVAPGEDASPENGQPPPVEALELRARPQRFVSVRLGRALTEGTYDVSARGFINLRQLSGGGDTVMVYEAPPASPVEEAGDSEAPEPEPQPPEEDAP